MDDENLKQVGKKIEQLGCILTLIFTVPIVLLLFLGAPGLIIGIIIAIIGVAGVLSKKKKNAEKT